MRPIRIIRDSLEGEPVIERQRPLRGEWSTFPGTLRKLESLPRRRGVETLQINLGRLCNQACSHCHVEAGPKRTERMRS